MLKPNQNIGDFFNASCRSIDGAVAICLSFIAIGLFLLDGIILLTGFSPFLKIRQWDTQWDVLLLFVPFMCIASYVTFPRFFVFQEASFMLPVLPVAER